MGRGRAKAKQQKVARDLKYNTSQFTDLDALRRELGSTPSAPERESTPTSWDDDEDEEGWASATR
ncbi:hypothetical protein SAMN05892883_1125 [Jatrophihabitans sp. GAS493]|uniref:DUF3073 domain-containing protein n=1 Tax=Jatrophihabitans sp. GAS493 TaxID=1907575 RepID=UPI000BB92F42|nr:DUF3073 domain-containing protein [Jatrophihabitans sp. GAS493]SOD71634.1 hypothetical protein SAMN05892883_1125 [Jatrophihabitans sp. GAS493]